MSRKGPLLVQVEERYPVFSFPHAPWAKASQAAVLLVWGRPGSGKSRYGHEMLHHALSILKPPQWPLQKVSKNGRSSPSRRPSGRSGSGGAPEAEGMFHCVAFLLEQNRIHSYQHDDGAQCPHMVYVQTPDARAVRHLLEEHHEVAKAAGQLLFVVVDSVTELTLESGRIGDRRNAIDYFTRNLPPGFYLLIAQVRENISPYGGSRPAVAVSNLHRVHVMMQIKRSLKSGGSLSLEITPVSVRPDRPIPPDLEVKAGSFEELAEMIRQWSPLAGWISVPVVRVQE